MSESLTIPEQIRHALTTPTGGVLGLVDDLLMVSREQGLSLDWRSDHCRVRFPGGDSPASIEVPLRKSVVRAALARIAVLCNERSPNSVSPYGGQGELSVGTDPATVLRVAFVNTPDEQRLELTPVRAGAPSASPPAPDQGPKSSRRRGRSKPPVARRPEGRGPRHDLG
jgi:hypothetical protein